MAKYLTKRVTPTFKPKAGAIGHPSSPSEEEIRIHFLSNMISNPRSEFNISLTSEEYASHIIEICEMAARDEERHNGNANN